MTFLHQALEGKPLTVFGDGSQTRSLCYVDDLIRGLYLLATSDEHLPVNIGNPDHELTMLELAQTCIKVTGSTSEIVFEALPVDDPQVRRPDITQGAPDPRLGAGGRPRGGPAALGPRARPGAGRDLMAARAVLRPSPLVAHGGRRRVGAAGVGFALPAGRALRRVAAPLRPDGRRRRAARRNCTSRSRA